MSEITTHMLSQFVANLEYAQIPRITIDHLKNCILDTIGCGLHGSTTKEGRMVAAVALDWSEKPESTIWGMGAKTACLNAVLANSTMVESMTLDDLHLKATLHPGCVAVPTAFALAERLGEIDGKQFLTAVTAGYETIIRVGMSIIPSARLRGFHPVSICAPFGSAAVAAKLLDLDQEKTLHAIGSAGTMGAGLMSAGIDSMVQRMQAARSAQSGLVAALLAKEGFTGVKNVLEAPYGGFCSTLADNYGLNKITDGLGEFFETDEVWIRPYAAAGVVHGPIDGLKMIMEEHHLSPETLESVTVKANKSVTLHSGWDYKPESVITAQMNIPYALAVVLLEGDAFVDQYTEEKIKDPRILELTKKVSVVHDPEMDNLGPEFGYWTKVGVKTKTGQVFERSVQYPKGSKGNPLTQSELMKKFIILGSKAIEEEKVVKIIDVVQNIEKESRVSKVVELLQ